MINCVVYLGIFDFIINGYKDLIEWVVSMFDEVVVVIVVSEKKGLLFFLNEWVKLVEDSISYLDNVKVIGFFKLFVYFCWDQEVNILLCGLCVVSDFEYEFQFVNMNCQLVLELEIVFLMLVEYLFFIFSFLVCEIVLFDGDVCNFVLFYVVEVLDLKKQQWGG